MTIYNADSFRTAFSKNWLNDCQIDWEFLNRYDSEILYNFHFKTLWLRTASEREAVVISEPLALENGASISPADYARFREEYYKYQMLLFFKGWEDFLAENGTNVEAFVNKIREKDETAIALFQFISAYPGPMTHIRTEMRYAEELSEPDLRMMVASYINAELQGNHLDPIGPLSPRLTQQILQSFIAQFWPVLDQELVTNALPAFRQMLDTPELSPSFGVIKARYDGTEFSTYCAQSYFSEYGNQINYEVIERYSSDADRMVLLQYYATVITEGNMRAEDGLQGNTEGLDLGDGRVVTPEEIEIYAVSETIRRQLDAYYVFERVFGVSTDPQEVLKVIRGEN